MEKYHNDDQFIASLVNARADYELGKNLDIHLDEIMRGIIEVKNIIVNARKIGEPVNSRQEVLIIMMNAVYDIRYKIVTSDKAWNVAPNTLCLVTDLSLSVEDFVQNTNLYFNAATLTYDIDSVTRTMDEQVAFGKVVPAGIVSLKEQLVILRDKFQTALNQENGII